MQCKQLACSYKPTMQAINAYINGWKIVFSNKKMWSLLYGFNFIIAILASIPVSSYLNQTLEHSLASSKLLDGFNYTLITDLRNEYGAGINHILDQSVLILILFFLSSIFLMGGILKTLSDEEGFNFGKFWKNCFYFFWRLFRLTIYFLLIHGAILGLFIFIFLRMTNNFSPFDMESDKQVMVAFQVVIPLYAIVASIFFMIQDYAKIHVAAQNPSILFSSFWQSFSIVFKNFRHFFSLYLLNILTLLALFGVYWLISKGVDNILMLAFLFSRFLFFSE